MIKTLRITSFITAVCAMAFFAFIVIFGDRRDETVQAFLNSPGVREKFESDEKNHVSAGEDHVSPLVKQAEAFALFLNPPKPELPKNIFTDRKSSRSFLGSSTPKFTVLATSYCEFNPEISLALIDEPGKGRHWVRQSEKVGYLIIEQVKDGLVIVKNDQETFEMPIKQTSVKGTPKGSSATSGGLIKKNPSKASINSLDKNVRSLKSRMPKLPQSKYDDPEKEARMEDLVNRLQNLQQTLETDGNSVDDEDREKAEIMNELVSKFKSSRITDEEAEKLDDLGEDLKDVQDEPNETGTTRHSKRKRLGSGRLIPQ